MKVLILFVLASIAASLGAWGFYMLATRTWTRRFSKPQYEKDHDYGLQWLDKFQHRVGGPR